MCLRLHNSFSEFDDVIGSFELPIFYLEQIWKVPGQMPILVENSRKNIISTYYLCEDG